MSANSETMNYKLPVFLANDIPSWLTDWNGSMRKIDELIFNANSNISDLKTKDTQVENTVNGVNERLTTVENNLDPSKNGIAKDVSTLETTVTNHTKQLTELDTVTTNLTTLCGDDTLKTTSKTLTGGVNDLFNSLNNFKRKFIGNNTSITLSNTDKHLKIILYFRSDHIEIQVKTTEPAAQDIRNIDVSLPSAQQALSNVETLIKSGVFNRQIVLKDENNNYYFISLCELSKQNKNLTAVLNFSDERIQGNTTLTGVFYYEN